MRILWNDIVNSLRIRIMETLMSLINSSDFETTLFVYTCYTHCHYHIVLESVFLGCFSSNIIPNKKLIVVFLIYWYILKSHFWSVTLEFCASLDSFRAGNTYTNWILVILKRRKNHNFSLCRLRFFAKVQWEVWNIDILPWFCHCVI